MFLLAAFFSVAFSFDFDLPFYADFQARSTSDNLVYEGSISLELKESRFDFRAIAWEPTGTALLYENSKMARLNRNQEVTCFEDNKVPPLNLLMGSLPFATAVDKNEVDPSIMQCQDGPLLKVPFVGLSYLVCLGGRTISVQGPDFIMTLQELDAPSPFLEFPDISACPASLRVMTHEVENDSWWKKPLVFVQAPQLSRDCVFIHGSGQGNPGPATPAFNDYWGDMAKFTPQCRSRSFIHLNTKDLGWQDSANQQQVCQLALKNNPGSKVINNTIVFTHSMGGLLFAGALQSGKCILGNSSTWRASQMPVVGSSLVNYLSNVCANTTLRKSIGQLMGLCNGDKPAGAYPSMDPSNPAFSSLKSVIKANLQGMMCGTSPFGLNSIYSLGLELVAIIGHLGSPNDGLVSWPVCSQSWSFGTAPTAKFYKADVNHADGTCRNGNGWWGSDRRPCDFFLNSV